MRMRDGVEQYLAELERRGASPHTLRNYGSDLAQFETYFTLQRGEAPPIETLELAELREWLSGLYDGGLTAVTVRRR